MYINGPEFDDLFNKIVTAVIENAIAKQYELTPEENAISELEKSTVFTENPVAGMPAPEPGLLEQFGNSCSTFFHSAYNTAHDLVCGKNEPEKAVAEPEVAPRSSVR